MCQPACTLNDKCSRRNEKSKKHRSGRPKMMKNDKNRFVSKILTLIEDINVSFSVSNNIHFLVLAEKKHLKFEKLNF